MPLQNNGTSSSRFWGGIIFIWEMLQIFLYFFTCGIFGRKSTLDINNDNEAASLLQLLDNEDDTEISDSEDNSPTSSQPTSKTGSHIIPFVPPLNQPILSSLEPSSSADVVAVDTIDLMMNNLNSNYSSKYALRASQRSWPEKVRSFFDYFGFPIAIITLAGFSNIYLAKISDTFVEKFITSKFPDAPESVENIAKYLTGLPNIGANSAIYVVSMNGNITYLSNIRDFLRFTNHKARRLLVTGGILALASIGAIPNIILVTQNISGNSEIASIILVAIAATLQNSRSMINLGINLSCTSEEQARAKEIKLSLLTTLNDILWEISTNDKDSSLHLRLSQVMALVDGLSYTKRWPKLQELICDKIIPSLTEGLYSYAFYKSITDIDGFDSIIALLYGAAIIAMIEKFAILGKSSSRLFNVLWDYFFNFPILTALNIYSLSRSEKALIPAVATIGLLSCFSAPGIVYKYLPQLGLDSALVLGIFAAYGINTLDTYVASSSFISYARKNYQYYFGNKRNLGNGLVGENLVELIQKEMHRIALMPDIKILTTYAQRNSDKPSEILENKTCKDFKTHLSNLKTSINNLKSNNYNAAPLEKLLQNEFNQAFFKHFPQSPQQKPQQNLLLPPKTKHNSKCIIS